MINSFAFVFTRFALVLCFALFLLVVIDDQFWFILWRWFYDSGLQTNDKEYFAFTYPLEMVVSQVPHVLQMPVDNFNKREYKIFSSITVSVKVF